MVEVGRRNVPFTELKNLRRQFGPGDAGKSAFRIIAKGVQCEGFSNEEGEKSRCIKPAILTLDFDVPKVNCLVQVPSCNDCKSKIGAKVEKDYKREGSFYSFSINGQGRA